MKKYCVRCGKENQGQYKHRSKYCSLKCAYNTEKKIALIVIKYLMVEKEISIVQNIVLKNLISDTLGKYLKKVIGQGLIN